MFEGNGRGPASHYAGMHKIGLVLALLTGVPQIALAQAPWARAGKDLWVSLSDSGQPEAVSGSNELAWRTQLPVDCQGNQATSFHRLAVDRDGKIWVEAATARVELDRKSVV